jgi:hypothetical protein
MLRTEECCQIATRGGGKIADQAGSGNRSGRLRGNLLGSRRRGPHYPPHTTGADPAY